MDWLTVVPPAAAIAVAVWSRNVYWALGLAILLSETLRSALNPALGVLGSIDAIVGVFNSAGNTRIVLFCLIVGALIAYMERSGGVSAMVTKLHSAGLASTPRRAGLISAFSGVIIFVETNVSLLASGVLGRPLFDRLRLSRERLAYIIDSTCAPISVLILFNGWGAYVAGLMTNNGVENAFSVLFQTIAYNFYPLITVALVFITIIMGRTFGALARADAHWTAPTSDGNETDAKVVDERPGNPLHMGIPLFILIGGALGFMVWTGNGDITQGSGSQAILWAVVLATASAYVFYGLSGRSNNDGVAVGFSGMSKLLPPVVVIILALALGDSLKLLGTSAFITGLAEDVATPFLIPAMLFVIAGITSFTTGTSWGTYGILVPIAIPMAVGADLPVALIVAAIMGGGVFGDHCSPISDTTIVASIAAGCDHMQHVRTQLPYALAAGLVAIGCYLVAGLLASGTNQIDEDQARSCNVACKSDLGFTPAFTASQVDQRQVGFSSART